MLYKKNSEKELSKELFKNPTCEYRGTPFWAWNCKLEKDELHRQIDVLKEMGFGGFHMHVRTGMATPYLSDEFMDIVSSCVKKAKDEKMLAWLYDEDRWPSGAAGGIVTKEKEYRARYLLFTHEPYGDNEVENIFTDSRASGARNGKGRFISSYDVELDCDGYLKSYKKIGENDTAIFEKWYAYLEINTPSSWFNNQTYVDTLNKKAIERFTEVTHERYKECVGDEFGNTVPAIFTDEPQFSCKHTLDNSTDKDDLTMPWTDDIPETYKTQYGEDILDFLPELFWDLPGGKLSVHRYHYHDHIAERFASSFADICGAWCRKNGIALTGHMMEEPTLRSQTAALGEAMRSYRGFDIPGIDMLCNNFEFTTAKQAQSAAHQFGREGILSEIYGVTGWDFDFRGHKIQGDWQAALGVTVRVPHLSWVSMAGEAKRDYPASIHYQSPWYKEYSYVENHFARVYTAMTRGQPIVKVGVIHPVESYWLHWGPNDKSGLMRECMNEKFMNITEWLLKGSIDFDFICESLFPQQCSQGGNPLKVGRMEYDAIVVPDCETLRSTTLDRLEKFAAEGGKLIFMGEEPKMEDAVISDRGRKLYEKSLHISFDREKLLSSLQSERTLTIRYEDGRLSKNLIYQLRCDNSCKWLFVSHCCNPKNKDIFNYENVRIYLDGTNKITVYDTITGEIYPADVEYSGGKTVVKRRMYDFDSLLLKIENGKNEEIVNDRSDEELREITIPEAVKYTLDEKNVLLLDQCEFKVDDGEYQAKEEILRADNKARKIIGIGEREGGVAQPWVIPPETPKHTITLRFNIVSEVNIDTAELALEDAQKAEICFNGQRLGNTLTGWYVDKSIKTIALTEIRKGSNELTIKLPLGNHTNTEWCYILGDFGVKATGRSAVITEKPKKIHFGDMTTQGFPFYGGNITYHFEMSSENGKMSVVIPQYRGALTKIIVDGEDKGNIVYSPNKLMVENLKDGKHSVDIKLFTNRFNSFGAVHNADDFVAWHGPDSWRTKNERWTYEYRLRKVGILSAPIISL